MFAAGFAILKVVFSPAQKLAAPEMAGVLGKGFAVTAIAVEAEELQPALV